MIKINYILLKIDGCQKICEAIVKLKIQDIKKLKLKNVVK